MRSAGSVSIDPVPLTCIVHDAARTTFGDGMDEELAHQLMQEFGDGLLLPGRAGNLGARVPSHVLEGTVRIDASLARASVRLFDGSDRLAWAEQFDGHAASPILLQEELAHAIRGALSGYFAAL